MAPFSSTICIPYIMDRRKTIRDMLGSTPFHDAAPPEMDTEGELPAFLSSPLYPPRNTVVLYPVVDFHN